MRTRITACIVIVLMFVGHVGQAQKNKATQKTRVELTEAQKEELKAAKIQFAKATLNVKNELNELQANQRTLMSAERLDEKKIYENIDKISVLKRQLAEEKINFNLATVDVGGKQQNCGRGNKMTCSKMKGQQMEGKQSKMQKGNGERFAQKRQEVNTRRGEMHRGDMKGIAQKRKQGSMNALGLSEEQKEQMKAVKIEHKKATEDLREEMEVLRLKQKHLLNDENINKKELASNLDRISVVQNQLAKESVGVQKEIRKILDKDQLVLFLSKSHKKGKGRSAGMQRAS